MKTVTITSKCSSTTPDFEVVTVEVVVRNESTYRSRAFNEAIAELEDALAELKKVQAIQPDDRQ